MRTSKLGLPFLAALILQLGSLHGEVRMAILAGAGTDAAADSLSAQLGSDHNIVLVKVQDQESGQAAGRQNGSEKMAWTE